MQKESKYFTPKYAELKLEASSGKFLNSRLGFPYA